jgi:hypothetical protein
VKPLASAVIAAAIAVVITTAGHHDSKQLPTVPGAVNHTVTQQWICAHGTRTIRPPVSYTNELKRTQIFALHLPGSPSDYEEDHLIPLSLGGAPFDARNLWPEPWEQAHESDRLEVDTWRRVCDGEMGVRAGRQIVLSFKRRNG